MRYLDIINEVSNGKNELYHGTGILFASRILRANVIYGQQYIDEPDDVEGVSLTHDYKRSKGYAGKEHWATWQCLNDFGKGGVYPVEPSIPYPPNASGAIFVFNEQYVLQHYKTISYTYDKEDEEVRVLGNMNNVLSCITRIDVKRPDVEWWLAALEQNKDVTDARHMEMIESIPDDIAGLKILLRYAS